LERQKLETTVRHRALADARILWRFIQKLYERVPPAHIEAAIRTLLVRPGLPLALGADTLERIPPAPGVYVMLGAAGHTLYIGKSIDLKTRVAAHFAGDAGAERHTRLVREVERIEWERTAGEVGALLRESQLVKQRLPAHNVRLRRRLAQGALRLDEGRPRWVRADAWQPGWRGRAGPMPYGPVAARAAADKPILGVFAEAATNPPQDWDGRAGPVHYGPFGSRAAARKAIDQLAREQSLCLKAMGYEGRARRSQPDAPCFNYQLHRCRGACVGLETPDQHLQRLREALEPWRLPDWPAAGAVALIERGDADAPDAWHVCKRWRWLGTAHTHAAALGMADGPLPPFDADEYHIIRDALQKAEAGDLEQVGLTGAAARAA
jgi:DNA polymerase-3 subunit epsilon